MLTFAERFEYEYNFLYEIFLMVACVLCHKNIVINCKMQCSFLLFNFPKEIIWSYCEFVFIFQYHEYFRFLRTCVDLFRTHFLLIFNVCFLLFTILSIENFSQEDYASEIADFVSPLNKNGNAQQQIFSRQYRLDLLCKQCSLITLFQFKCLYCKVLHLAYVLFIDCQLVESQSFYFLIQLKERKMFF